MFVSLIIFIETGSLCPCNYCCLCYDTLEIVHIIVIFITGSSSLIFSYVFASLFCLLFIDSTHWLGVKSVKIPLWLWHPQKCALGCCLWHEYRKIEKK